MYVMALRLAIFVIDAHISQIQHGMGIYVSVYQDIHKFKDNVYQIQQGQVQMILIHVQ